VTRRARRSSSTAASPSSLSLEKLGDTALAVSVALQVGIGEICSREVLFVGRNESVADAARLMRQHHIGSVVVADRTGGRLVPAGMITDRDVTVGVVALGLDPEKTPVEAAMRAELVSVRETEGVGRAVQLMRSQGVRRLPVVDNSGALVGLVAADDLLELFGEELSALAAVVARGPRREREERRASGASDRSRPARPGL
jgi:CBS domain-containing protein